jgi:hypothetical protein
MTHEKKHKKRHGETDRDDRKAERGTGNLIKPKKTQKEKKKIRVR